MSKILYDQWYFCNEFEPRMSTAHFVLAAADVRLREDVCHSERSAAESKNL